MPQTPHESHGPASTAKAGWRAPYAAAHRHSARVQLFRYAIIIACVGIFAFLGFVSLVDPLRKLNLSGTFDSVGVEGEKVTLHNPRLTGVRNDGQPFEVVARIIEQDTKKPKIFNLQDAVARLGAKDGTTVRIEASKGVYDSANDQIDLRERVRISNAGRYDMDLMSALVNMKLGDFASNDPVTAKLSNGVIESKAIMFFQNDQHVVFSQGVHSEFSDDSNSAPVNATVSGATGKDLKSE